MPWSSVLTSLRRGHLCHVMPSISVYERRGRSARSKRFLHGACSECEGEQALRAGVSQGWPAEGGTASAPGRQREQQAALFWCGVKLRQRLRGKVRMRKPPTACHGTCLTMKTCFLYSCHATSGRLRTGSGISLHCMFAEYSYVCWDIFFDINLTSDIMIVLKIPLVILISVTLINVRILCRKLMRY